MDTISFPLAAFSAYALGTASPGPANMSIMATSIEAGRNAGLAMAIGVISGSLSWGLLAATGLGALLVAYPSALQFIQIAGGLFFLWLASRTLTVVLSRSNKGTPSLDKTGQENQRFVGHFLRGLGVHLTNPKAVLVWTTTITLGMPLNGPPALAYLIVGGCTILGVFIFCGYALAFSTETMVREYLKARRPINAVVTVFYTVFGVELLLTALWQL